MRFLLSAFSVIALTLTACAVDPASTYSVNLGADPAPAGPEQAACFDRVKADAIAGNWTGDAYQAALVEQCGLTANPAEPTTPGGDADPVDECANQVKAEAIAAAEAGKDFDYPGELAARCGVVIDPGTPDPTTDPSPDDPAAACANEVKAEAIAAEAAGQAYDYAGELAARCGIVFTP
ncbi:MAG: hypothetical protein H7138_05735 [Myxococcales bacterium]|nr:hypothetical protein [Myxococcales bacterium]